jgi:hypothetical protein
VPQAASPQPRTPTRQARPGLHLEVSSATRAPRIYKKRGAFGSDDDGDAESDRIKVLTETFVGSRGRLHNVTMLYVQEDINESFVDSEHMAVALMWSGSGVGKIAKDYKIKKKVSMLGNAFEGRVARTIVQFVRHVFIFVHGALSGIFTRFYGDRPPNILVDEGKFFIEKGTWFMSAVFIDGYGAQPHKDIKRMGFERMKRFFASDANDLGATVKEIVINVCDWNQFVIANRSEFEKNADVPTAQSVFDEM